MKNNLIIGSHISLNKNNKYLLGVVEETIQNKANCFMVFTGTPRNANRQPISNFFLNEAFNLAEKNNINLNNCVTHAPYIINLASNNIKNKDFYNDFLINEIKRSLELKINLIVLHPGFHNGQTLEDGIKNIIENLKIVLQKTKNLEYFLLLETMAGKKNQIGKNLEELKEIIDGCNDKKINVCLDTCHLHDAGYDLSKKDEFLEKFDKLIGIKKIKAIHLGDSMNAIGSKKDRHANLNYGYIGFETIMKWVNDVYISKIPIIIETPYWIYKNKNNVKKLISPYKHEIEIIKNNSWKKIPYKQYKPIFNIKKIN